MPELFLSFSSDYGKTFPREGKMESESLLYRASLIGTPAPAVDETASSVGANNNSSNRKLIGGITTTNDVITADGGGNLAIGGSSLYSPTLEMKYLKEMLALSSYHQYDNDNVMSDPMECKSSPNFAADLCNYCKVSVPELVKVGSDSCPTECPGMVIGIGGNMFVAQHVADTCPELCRAVFNSGGDVSLPESACEAVYLC